MINIDELAVFCKKKGFIYPSSEIYGGMSGFFDFGPLGVELKNNIKAAWWKAHVHDRDDVTGIDGSIITNPKVWVASGHVGSFTDALLECSKCGFKTRADHFIEDKLHMDTAGLPLKQIDEIVRNHRLKCEKCGSQFRDAEGFNLMFQTNVGPIAGSVAYLRPETAQVIFADFRQVTDTSRLKLPFGIAQVGKAFRNEISPRDFIFRCREFEQMELEYFVRPDQVHKCPYLEEFKAYELMVYSAEMQEKKQEARNMSVGEALHKGIIKTPWHAYWLAFEHAWFAGLGVRPERLRIRQHLDEEKSHYALDTWDLEYHFPFGWKELQGMANRTDFDLQQHIKHSKKDLAFFDEESKAKVIPHVVVEPSQGVERAFAVFMLEAYHDDKKRGNIVLKLHPKLAPFKAAVFPLVANKPELVKKAREIYAALKPGFNIYWDQSGSVGRRYARADEIGVPACITVDFDSLEDESVTIRSRDTTEQVRVPASILQSVLADFLSGRELRELGKAVKSK